MWAVPGSNGRPPACKARAGAAASCRLSPRPRGRCDESLVAVAVCCGLPLPERFHLGPRSGAYGVQRFFSSGVLAAGDYPTCSDYACDVVPPRCAGAAGPPAAGVTNDNGYSLVGLEQDLLDLRSKVRE